MDGLGQIGSESALTFLKSLAIRSDSAWLRERVRIYVVASEQGDAEGLVESISGDFPLFKRSVQKAFLRSLGEPKTWDKRRVEIAHRLMEFARNARTSENRREAFQLLASVLLPSPTRDVTDELSELFKLEVNEDVRRAIYRCIMLTFPAA